MTKEVFVWTSLGIIRIRRACWNEPIPDHLLLQARVGRSMTPHLLDWLFPPYGGWGCVLPENLPWEDWGAKASTTCSLCDHQREGRERAQE